ncbi:hypothetical protein ACFL5C_03645, partial [Candidatus Omnitrophota bacterium]
MKPEQDKINIAEWNKKMFTEKIDPSTTGGDKDALADLYHKKAIKLLKEYQKNGDLKNLYTALNCTGEAITLNP